MDQSGRERISALPMWIGSADSRRLVTMFMNLAQDIVLNASLVCDLKFPKQRLIVT